MLRVFLSWFYSILIGSCFIGFLAITKEPSGEGFFLAMVISTILSALWSLPLLITELISSAVILKSTQNFTSFSIVKYVVAFLTIMCVFIYTYTEDPRDTLFQYGSLVVAIAYGSRGLFFHLYYIRPVFKHDSKNTQLENEDLLDN